jgi:hypothetical protein
VGKHGTKEVPQGTAKQDLESAIADVLGFCKKEGKDPDPALNGGNMEFSFKYGD